MCLNWKVHPVIKDRPYLLLKIDVEDETYGFCRVIDKDRDTNRLLVKRLYFDEPAKTLKAYFAN